MKLIQPPAGKKAVLVKDKSNKLAFVVPDEFVYMVDHYNAVDSSNRNFRLYGTAQALVNTNNGADTVKQIVLKLSSVQGQALLELVKSKDASIIKLLRLEPRPMMLLLDTLVRMVTLGRFRLNEKKLVLIKLFNSPILSGQPIDKQDSLVISSIYFDHILKVPDVKDIYVDFDALFRKSVAAQSSCQSAAVGAANTPAGSPV